MNKRQRKKNHRAEFREYGFLVELDFDPPLDDTAADRLVDAWIQFLEDRGLHMGGGHSRTGLMHFVSLGRSAPAASEHRDACIAWLRAHAAPHRVHASAVVDAMTEGGGRRADADIERSRKGAPP